MSPILAKIAQAGFGCVLAVAIVSSAVSAAEISGLAGPDAPVGMSIKELGKIELGPEFPAISEAENYVMRSRFVTVEAGGLVPIHSHTDRPAVTYILQGEIIGHRSDQAEPTLYEAGDAAFDHNGIAHWWENKTDEAVTMFVVDFFDTTVITGAAAQQ